MKILFVLEYYYPNVGGAEKLFKSLAEELAARHFEVEILTTRFRNDLPAREVLNGVSIRRENCFNRFFFTFLAIPAALRRAAHFDLVITTSYTAAFPAWLAAKMRRKKSLIIFHEGWDRLWFRLPYLSVWQRYGFYFFEKFILKLPFDTFVAVSEFTRRSLESAGIAPAKIQTIHNGLDYKELPNQKPEKPARFTATYLGRLGVSKGLDLLLPAAAAFVKTHPDSLFKIILPLRPAAFLRRIKKEMTELGLGDKNIKLLHELSRENLYREMLQSTCILTPSYSEGFGFVAAEAVGLGLPLISSQQGALPEVVGGHFIAMENQSPEALRAALEKAYAGEWSYLPPKYFPLEETVERYVEMIDRSFSK